MSDASEPGDYPVAVFGCGRMGRLHARVYSEMPGVRLVGVYDRDPAAARETAEKHGCRAFFNPDEAAAAGVLAATVAVPTTAHEAVAAPLIGAGVACLIEKPLAGDVATARRIADLAEKSGVVVQVGHIERFNPAVRSLSALGVEPRYVEVVRISPLTFRSIDVGVVLDVMIHDIDIVLSLAKSEVTNVQAHGVSVVGGGDPANPAEDVCNARLTFANGCVANLTASRLALKVERRLRVFSARRATSASITRRSRGLSVRRTGNVELLRETVAKIRDGEITDMAGLDFAELVNVESLTIDDVEPLRAQLDAFVSSARDGAPVAVPASAGVAAVEVAERIVAAMPERALE